jgi:hypothetical protein
MTVEIQNIRTNRMGTASFDMKLKGMRKFQDFIVYPISKDDTEKVIKVQSDTRIGYIDLKDGKVQMTKSFQGGAYNHHLVMTKLDNFQLTDVDTQTLRMHIFTTASPMAGTNGVMYCDNSGAENVLKVA